MNYNIHVFDGSTIREIEVQIQIDRIEYEALKSSIIRNQLITANIQERSVSILINKNTPLGFLSELREIGTQTLANQIASRIDYINSRIELNGFGFIMVSISE